MLITKEIAIERFRNACSVKINEYVRASAIENQINRNFWQINDDNGWKIRIENAGAGPKITVYITTLNPNFPAPPVVMNLTTEEYKELESLFIGDFGPGPDSDSEYAKEIIDEEANYEFSNAISESETEQFIYDGKVVKQIILWYRNTIDQNRTGYIKMDGGAMINEKYFDKMLDADNLAYQEAIMEVKQLKAIITGIETLIKKKIT